MAQTYAQLRDQISKLQTEAARLKKAEFATIVAKMREDITIYEITPQDLFGKAARQIGASKSKSTSPPKYGDGVGNFWGGVARGPGGCVTRSPPARRLKSSYLAASPPRSSRPLASR